MQEIVYSEVAPGIMIPDLTPAQKRQIKRQQSALAKKRRDRIDAMTTAVIVVFGCCAYALAAIAWINPDWILDRMR